MASALFKRWVGWGYAAGLASLFTWQRDLAVRLGGVT
jgi:hypothetical protein